MGTDTLTVVSIFDEEKGLMPIWHTALLTFEEDLPYTISVKSLTSVLIQESPETGEMIIPFPAYSLFGFVYYFMLDSAPISITFVIPEDLKDLLYKQRQNLTLTMQQFVTDLELNLMSKELAPLKDYIQKRTPALSVELKSVLFGSDISSKVQWFPSELRLHGTRLSEDELAWLGSNFPVKAKMPGLKDFADTFLSFASKDPPPTEELRYFFVKSCYLRGFYDPILIIFHSINSAQPPAEPSSIWYAAAIYRKGEPRTAYDILQNLSFENDRIPEIERLGFLSFVSNGLTQYDESEKFASLAINMAEESQDEAELQASLIARYALAISYSLRGQYEQVKEIIHHALNIASNPEFQDRHWQAWLLNALSISEESRGVVEESILSIFRAKQFFEQINHAQGLAIINNNLGNVYFLQGKYEECLIYYENAYLALQDVGDQQNASKSLSNLARAYNRLGQYREALRFAERAYKNLKEFGDKDGMTDALIRIGQAYRGLGELSVAQNKLQAAKDLALSIFDRKALALAYLEVGEILVVKDEYLEAEGWLNGALNAFKMFDIKGNSLARCYLLLARCLAYQNQFNEAYQNLEKAQLIALSLESKILGQKCKIEKELITMIKNKEKQTASDTQSLT